MVLILVLQGWKQVLRIPQLNRQELVQYNAGLRGRLISRVTPGRPWREC